MSQPWLLDVKARHLRGGQPGIFAVCSAHPTVLTAAMEAARRADRHLLVEATANQVNQFGGYTGLTPEAFAGRLQRLCLGVGLPAERLLIGADHLGPHLWHGVSPGEAMDRTRTLVQRCVAAGFDKIHLDTGAPCASEPGPLLPLGTAARRAAELCVAAEAAARQAQRGAPPCYVIGNETPLPGGALAQDRGVAVTDPDELGRTLAAFERAFSDRGLEGAWQRVLAVVVQPGVEFGDRQMAAFDARRAAALSAAHGRLPGIMTFEVHATDYQTPAALHGLVAGHFTILKTGPCLTFALRRTLYALAAIESALPEVTQPARLTEVMERLMVAHPAYWQSHLGGDAAEQEHLRHHGLRDRIRYYWSFPQAGAAVERLMANLRRPIPDALLAEQLPWLYPDIREQGLGGDPLGIVKLGVRQALSGYRSACWGEVDATPEARGTYQ